MIKVRNLIVEYKDLTAVDGISFDVSNNEIFGMIGPNGAGKTTTIECIEGLREPTAGSIDVMGIAPSSHKELYRNIGVQLQEASFPDAIRVGEVCRLFASFYGKPIDYRELLVKFGLEGKQKAPVRKLSGGEKQKLSIVTALIGGPVVVFLDELTTGLDPKSRIDMWELVKSLRDEGKTVFMTTHYMDEAEYLCDRVCMMLQGKIAALGTVPDLIEQAGVSQKISFASSKAPLAQLHKVAGVEQVTVAKGMVEIRGRGKDLERDVMTCLIESKAAFEQFHSMSPNLGDAFLALTGEQMGEQK